ncbi:zf-HC2 domain-containing protein [Marinobacterium jannaschii]|uniref:zf-HC2 domain-containing protein n=1 Tax=Marinobacterium jannaschii TaxID=64970 RepID=UPI0004865455|nr:zf-HC2 domain-containing protein [Marinobacterium jannaschii]
MMNCKQATRMLSDAQERPLTLKERSTLKLHLMMCSGCRNFGDQMQSLRGFARDYSHKPGDGDPSE